MQFNSYNHDGSTDTINLVEDQPSVHRLAFRKNDKNYYAKLGEPNHPEASKLHVRRNGKTFAAMKNYDPIIFDECGNTWIKSGNPYVDSPGAHFGTALQLPGSSYLSLLTPLQLFGQDFTIELFASINQYIKQLHRYVYITFSKGAVSIYKPTNNNSMALTLSANSSTWTFFATSSEELSTKHHFEIDYSFSENKTYVFRDGILKNEIFGSVTVERMEASSFPIESIIASAADFYF